MDKKASKKTVSNAVKDAVTLGLAPAKDIAAASGIGIGTGVLASVLMKLKKDKDKRSAKDTIRLYQAIESPYADEESVIDEYIAKKSELDKESFTKYDPLVLAGAAAVPGYLGYNTLRDAKEAEKLSEGRREVGDLRDAVNEAYREDLMKAYGIESEDQLEEVVKDLRIRAGEQDMDNKTAANILNTAVPLSTPAVLAGTGAMGLTGFLSMKNKANRTNPARLQEKEYLNKLDRLYRERLVSPTIRELPFTDEELIAMELHKQEKGRRAPKVEESPEPLEVREDIVPEGAQVVDMDDEDIQAIMKEL